ncbi:MAG: hypothetical protein M1819_001111 [Sarea resinae]|nr:MAG: hypothetical protein M1819_001111 [Sarea resinae]
MASAFLAAHGVNLQQEMTRVQFGEDSEQALSAVQSPGHQHYVPISRITGVYLPGRDTNTLWDVTISPGLNEHQTRVIESIEPHQANRLQFQHPSIIDAEGQFLGPSLCHPHIHLDKAFLLSHPKYADLEIERGDFAEAMDITSQAKARFDDDDLLERGRQLIKESVSCGVTCMRAFVEVDGSVGLKCLEAGLKLKKEFRERCLVQICAFAQLPAFSGDDGGSEVRKLMEEAAEREDVAVLGSTPYVEADENRMKENVEWIVELAVKHHKHLDLHLDYFLDAERKPLIWYLLDVLKKRWLSRAWAGKRIALGHCTRLTLFEPEEWRHLVDEIGDLPIHFVGLPTSDLFMMGRPEEEQPCSQRTRGTLQILEMIQNHGLQGAIGVNNVGNAFTPQGTCDPLSVASLGVGIYQAASKQDTDVLYVGLLGLIEADAGANRGHRNVALRGRNPRLVLQQDRSL